MIKRRDFCALGLAGTALPVLAQPAFVEGKHYKRLRTPQPVSNRQGEVLEFFWYGCPSCYALEPTLNQWVARKPAAISFRRSHANIRAVSKPHQRIFFTLDAMGLVESLHARIFAAIQLEHQPLQELPEIKAYMAKLGVDAAKFGQTYDSFSVQSRCRQADNLQKNFETTGVPTLAVNGRFTTSPAEAGGAVQVLQVVDHLLRLPA